MAKVTGTGILSQVPSDRSRAARLATADRPGEHLWVMMGSWILLDPERPDHQLDTENMLMFEGPGCLKCERLYSRKLARLACTGTVS